MTGTATRAQPSHETPHQAEGTWDRAWSLGWEKGLVARRRPNPSTAKLEGIVSERKFYRNVYNIFFKDRRMKANDNLLRY